MKREARQPRWPRAGSLAVAGLFSLGIAACLAMSCARLAPLADAELDHAAELGGHSARGHAHGHGHAAVDDHDHDHDHPAASPKPGAAAPGSFADALARIIELDSRIRADPEAAHGDLHAIGHLLEELPGLAQTAGVPLDAAAVKRSAGILFEAFSRIDDKLHGQEGSTYAEEAGTIGR
ncbi:MAG: hypothetical protein WD072_12590, partial [Pirellulales bacterium]